MLTSNATQAATAAAKGSIVGLFDERARAFADAVALRTTGHDWTYAELDGRSDRLARRLMTLGIGPGDRVALLVERSPAAICALLAVLKAGAAYVPLDLDYPCAHLAAMIADSRPAALIVDSGGPVPEGLSWTGPTVSMDAAGRVPGEVSEGVPLPVRDPGDLAYVMYTSGSTGRPKGVMVPDRGVVRLVDQPDYASFGADDVYLQLAPLAFDAATLEIWAPLLNGGQLTFPDRRRPSLREIGAMVRSFGVTNLLLTTGLFHLMVDEALDDLAGLRQLLAGGDVLSPTHVRKVLDALPHCRLINVYGPTENTTFTCCFTIPRDQPAGAIPIGHPIRGTQVYILDDALNPVAAGEAGQLCAGGEGVAIGYLDRPDLTDERFLPDIHSPIPGGRLYLTGDLVRRRLDGVIEFLGRLDTQVKIDGKRVELGEIESVLRGLPGVRDAAVAAVQADAYGKRLHAFVVSTGPSPLDLVSLRAALAVSLPAHMRPATLEALPHLPLNVNGKVDRSALAAEASRNPERPRSFAEPRTETERRIASVWRNVLAIDEVGIEDNFFERGGSSLKLLAVHQRLTEQGTAAVSVIDLFARPTIRALAELIDGAADRTAVSASVGARGLRQAGALKRLGTLGRHAR
ncbi:MULTISPECIES: non-ribosomal peptide synthetase [Methylobacterium]|uniref:non-ribosomal peptide synthetase n=1 Tax=Methylobacterium TaxID=407 RepID=UPI000A9B380A|nr:MULTISPECIES: non-ribosomal peptide synthetase [Methylobacterium]MCI9882453.1 non-ribosomal peptide synthetase [Methylobacterium goesingense]